MTNVKKPQPGYAVRVVGVAVLCVLAWRKGLFDGGAGWAWAVGTVAVIGLAMGALRWWSRRADRVRQQLQASRPDLTTHAVWADETLGAALRELAIDAGRVRAGTTLTLAWSTTHVELWRGEEQITAVPWEQVSAVTATTGRAAATPNPAVELTTRTGTRLVLVPARRPEGGVLPARTAQVDALVEQLRAVRGATSAARG